MANPACTFCGDKEGVLMATNLTDGDTAIACGDCLPGYAIGMAAAMLNGMTPELATEYAAMITGAVPQAAPAPPERPPPAGRKPRRQASSKQPPLEPVSDAPVPVELSPPCEQCGGTSGTGDAHRLTCDGCGHVIATVPEPPGWSGDDGKAPPPDSTDAL